jgi:uncharacterized protein (DUF433 family)
MSPSNNIIVKDPDILGGTPVFRGTRVPVQALFDSLEGGETLEEFLEGFPSVTRDMAIAALEQAKEVLSNPLVNDRPNARSGGATVRLERERISKESLGTTLGMSCDGRNDRLPAVRVASAAVWNSMATVISLREVIGTLEMQGENCLSYLDPDTGEIVTATEEVRVWQKRRSNLKTFSLNGSARWCGGSAPCWRAAAACSCRTASGFMSGLL